MRFSVVLAALAAAVAVRAAEIVVKVGANASLIFDPSDLQIQAGDTVSFQFQGKNHSVTQSTFASPCSPMANGVDSGFFPVSNGSASLPQWSITVQNVSAPLWFFCAQTNPANHCHAGMVLSINATPAKSFAAFKATAMGTNSTTATNGTSTATGASASGTATSTDSTTSPSASSPANGMRIGGTSVAMAAAAILVGLIL